MLNDRLPFTVETALLMCSAKGRFIEHVWKTQVNIYTTFEDKRQAIFKILGKKHEGFDFKRALDIKNVDLDERQYWEYVASWVEWMQSMGLVLREVYLSSVEKGLTDEQLISLFSEKYKMNSKKAKILIKAFKNKY